ncbi:MAG: hypothetical protein QS721_15020 [Candidatus Endonucleobacter sp. (ex Gigantidas childressi)]|nr:hypothetical protein [Candidatus Endonucleobacter sp. (ex Gigantidas childressi)]
MWANKQADSDLYMHLRRQGKKYDKRRNGKSTRGQIKNRVSTDDSPESVDDKSGIGGREIDTIIGKGYSVALVTIVELVTKYTVSAQVNSKSAADVTKARSACSTHLRVLFTPLRLTMVKSFRTMRKSAKHYRRRFILRIPTALGSEGYIRRLSICYVVGFARSPRSPTTRRLMGASLTCRLVAT